MLLDTALARFPAESPLPDLLRRLSSPNSRNLEAGYRATRDRTRNTSWEEARTANWEITEPEATELLRVVTEIEFPAPPARTDWEDGLHDLLFELLRSPHSSLAPAAGAAYPRQATWRRKCALLALLGVIGTREAAEIFTACVREHGWPPHAYGRVFEELGRLFAFPEVLLPDILTTADKNAAAQVSVALIDALGRGILEPARAGDRLEILAPMVVKQIKRLVKSAAKHQRAEGLVWRFAARYEDVRRELGIYLDLAGYLRAPKLLPLLQEAARLPDPKPAAFAALSLLRRGEPAEEAALERAAACHETRALLFEGLRGLEREELFPEGWRTWEAFAAAQMVEWLSYPAELGREPDELELGHTVRLKDGRVMYVWKFRVGAEPWLAGVSGPHQLSGAPQPLHGELTFSRFEEWDSAAPSEHLERCTGTVREIQSA